MWCLVVEVVGAGKPAPAPAGVSVHHWQGFRADSLDWPWEASLGFVCNTVGPLGLGFHGLTLSVC